MSKLLLCSAIALVFLLFESRPVWTQSRQGVVENELDNSKETLAKLYSLIRSVALPPPSEDATGSEAVTQRLVLLLPGKVLNYYDYFPGDAYQASLEDPHHDGQQVPLPPRVMENMFALADIIPGVEAFRGFESGESMAIIYENILNRLEVKSFTEKTQDEKKRYITALDYLAEELPDPLDVTQNVTRFQLYRRSQDLYNKRRLDMEDMIASKRTELPQIEFELWFQRNYPTLNSQVEGAYTEWLIFGQKEIVELYKSYLDVESPGIDLEKARMALRASGVSSLDRTRTLYPVSFVPSDWYRYLTNVTTVDAARQNRQAETLSRDQIQYKIGELESKKLVLQALKQANPSNELIQNLTALKRRLDSSNSGLSSSVMSTEQLRQRCLSSRIREKARNSTDTGPTQECKEYISAISAASEDLIGLSALDQCVRDLDFQINSTGLTHEALDGSISSIDEEIGVLKTRLLLASPKYPRLALQAASTQDQLDSRWLRFNFNSSSEYSEVNSASSSSYSSIAVRAKVRSFWGSARASYSRSSSRSESSFNRQINSASATVEGELLRVAVQRPWFRPSLFKSTQFKMRLDEDARVSPGPMQEDAFVRELTGKNRGYLLPQYATGLLLARNVVIDFGLHKASDSYHAVRSATHSSASGGFSIGFFSASASVSYGSTRRDYNAKVETTATGIRVQIPGVQLIGYYTQVVPSFPPPKESKLF